VYCDSFKSPKPERNSFGFNKDFWADFKDDFRHFMTEFDRNQNLSRGINNIFIALIPKVKSSQRFADFRPISMVGSMYRVLSKILSNILR